MQDGFTDSPLTLPPRLNTFCYLLKEKNIELFLQKVIRRLVKKEVIPMKRIWIILLTASLLVLAGCGGKEPVAFSGSKESQPPGMETSADSASPVENTALQQESTENIANVKEPAEARTTEYVPAASVTTADENEAPSPDADKIAHAYATQILVWETVVGERDANFNHVSTGSYDPIKAVLRSGHPLYSRINSYYDSIVASVQNHTKIPSFMKKSSGSAQEIELEWNGSVYTATLTDTNGVLSNFSFTANVTGMNFCSRECQNEDGLRFRPISRLHSVWLP